MHAQACALTDEQAGIDVPRMDALLLVAEVDAPGRRPGQLKRRRSERAALAHATEQALLELARPLALRIGPTGDAAGHHRGAQIVLLAPADSESLDGHRLAANGREDLIAQRV